MPNCLHGNGPIPDPATLGPDADWLWSTTSHMRRLTEPSQNGVVTLRAGCASDRYLTRDELPVRRR